MMTIIGLLSQVLDAQQNPDKKHEFSLYGSSVDTLSRVGTPIKESAYFRFTDDTEQETVFGSVWYVEELNAGGVRVEWDVDTSLVEAANKIASQFADPDMGYEEIKSLLVANNVDALVADVVAKSMRDTESAA